MLAMRPQGRVREFMESQPCLDEICHMDLPVRMRTKLRSSKSNSKESESKASQWAAVQQDREALVMKTSRKTSSGDTALGGASPKESATGFEEMTLERYDAIQNEMRDEIARVAEDVAIDFPTAFSCKELQSILDSAVKNRKLRDQLKRHFKDIHAEELTSYNKEAISSYQAVPAAKTEWKQGGLKDSTIEVLFRITADQKRELERLTQESEHLTHESEILMGQVEKLTESNESLVKQNIALRRQVRDLKTASVTSLNFNLAPQSQQQLYTAKDITQPATPPSTWEEIAECHERETSPTPLETIRSPALSRPHPPPSTPIQSRRSAFNKLAEYWTIRDQRTSSSSSPSSKSTPPRHRRATSNSKDIHEPESKAVSATPTKLTKKPMTLKHKRIQSSGTSAGRTLRDRFLPGGEDN